MTIGAPSFRPEAEPPRRAVRRGALVAWTIAMAVTGLVALVAVVGGIAGVVSIDRSAPGTVTSVEAAEGLRGPSACRVGLDYAVDGAPRQGSTAVSFAPCPEGLAVGDAVEVRYRSSAPDAPLIAGREWHELWTGAGIAVVLTVLPAVAVWAFGLDAWRRRRHGTR